MLSGLWKCSTLFTIRKSCNFYRCGRNLSARKSTQLTELSNGLKIATEETCSYLVSVSIFILTGSRFENACCNGISHVIEHMAFTGFNSLDKNNIEEKLNGIGAKITAHTDREYQYFSGTTTPENVSEIVDIFSKIVCDLQLSESELELEKEKIWMETEENDRDTKKLLFDYLHQTAFQGTALSQTITPSSENLKLFDTNMITSLMSHNYTPSRIVLAASGNLSHEYMVGLARNKFGGLCESECSQQPNYGLKRFTGSQIIYRDDSMPYLHVAIAVEAPGYNNRDYLPFYAANCFIGSWHASQARDINHASYLARAASSANLCEQYQSFYIPYKDVGLWGIYFKCTKMDAKPMTEYVLREWMTLCTTITDSDLQRAINVTKLKLARKFNGCINSCIDIGRQVLLTSQRIPLDTLHDELNCLSGSDIKGVCETYIYDRCPAVVAIGPSEALPDYTRVRSGMYWYPL